MRKGKLFLIVVILVIAIALIFVGCSSSQNGTAGTDEVKTQDVVETLPTNTDTPDDNTELPDVEVDIVNFVYSPNEITIPTGTTVIWLNNDSVIHTVTSDDGIFDSDSLPGGATFSFTFSKSGIYPYHCIPHPYMKATIIVE
jgi:plastocyanin